MKHPQIILVTGASSGFGRVIATQLAAQGHIVYGSSRKAVSDNPGFTMLQLDITDPASVSNAISTILKEQGSIDVLVNNAGIDYIGLLQDMSSEDWDRILRTNLTSVFNCCKLAIPLMLPARHGKIVNISSVWGCVGASCEVAYSATKGGINAFTKALAKELAPSNIQVNAVACGAIDTEMNQWMEEDELIQLVEEIPAGRLGRAEEVADFVYHLGYKGSYLTGQVIGLDGGWI